MSYNHNCNHFTGKKGSKIKRKKNMRSKRVHINKYGTDNNKKRKTVA